MPTLFKRSFKNPEKKRNSITAFSFGTHIDLNGRNIFLSFNSNETFLNDSKFYQTSQCRVFYKQTGGKFVNFIRAETIVLCQVGLFYFLIRLFPKKHLFT